MIYYIIEAFCLYVPLLMAIAFYILAERKIMGFMQSSRGPNIVGYAGALQPFADGLKAVLKEQLLMKRANFFFYFLAPVIIFSLSLFGWCLIVLDYTDVCFDTFLSFLCFYTMNTFGVFGMIFSGWSSNSKYPLLGALRGAAQVISFEISLGLLLLPIFCISGTVNIFDITFFQKEIWNMFLLLPTSVFYFMTLLAETNSTPFDLPEAEAELVAGYNTEYSSIIFAMFFLGEYSNMLLNSALFSILFIGGWLTFDTTNFLYLDFSAFYFIYDFTDLFFFSLKTVFISILFMLVRATVPSLRFDQLMVFCWKEILPFAFSMMSFILMIMFFFDASHMYPMM